MRESNRRPIDNKLRQRRIGAELPCSVGWTLRKSKDLYFD